MAPAEPQAKATPVRKADGSAAALAQALCRRRRRRCRRRHRRSPPASTALRLLARAWVLLAGGDGGGQHRHGVPRLVRPHPHQAERVPVGAGACSSGAGLAAWPAAWSTMGGSLGSSGYAARCASTACQADCCGVQQRRWPQGPAQPPLPLHPPPPLTAAARGCSPAGAPPSMRPGSASTSGTPTSCASTRWMGVGAAWWRCGRLLAALAVQGSGAAFCAAWWGAPGR